MGAPDLLKHLRRLGFDLAAVDGGGIRVSPYSTLTDNLKEEIRDNRGALLDLLAVPSAAVQAAHDAFEERAGVREYDGGLPRQAAEQVAATDLGIRVACLTCAHRSRRKTCLRPVEAGLTSSFEIVWCELLPDSQCPAFEASPS